MIGDDSRSVESLWLLVGVKSFWGGTKFYDLVEAGSEEVGAHGIVDISNDEYYLITSKNIASFLLNMLITPIQILLDFGQPPRSRYCLLDAHLHVYL